ncbi:toxin-antitoxin system YwqK family antitoxin [Sphingobacterium suaedae]|uniref:Toxin-antitoxin system YwqK family antitoxin n=1 Tax=Sphingobacterium suaedae TaxID=1686402 RepID=A0ABW5KRF7_9SPHI
MKKIGLFLLLSLTGILTFAQQVPVARDTLFEKAPQGLVRFYFDDHYFLVDKDCAFKSIERLSAFVVSKNAFHGEFKDFDRNGRVVLTGTYNQGVKAGPFKAYHPNGTLKWESTFVNNVAVGDWNYYYPDGRPMLTVTFDSTGGRIKSFWDRFGRQRVTAGEGNYEFKMPFEFYNEYGYPFFERKGKIRNGIPTGYWTTHMVDEKNKKILFTEEVYDRNGALTDGYNLFLDSEYKVPLTIIPSQSFLTAERMLFKACTFDDYSGFNSYLSDKLNSAFGASPTHKNLEDDFSYRVSLDKDGNPEMITLRKRLKSDDINRYFEAVLKEIPFYFPSLDENGEPIADTLAVSGKLSTNEVGAFNFHSIRIERGKKQED